MQEQDEMLSVVWLTIGDIGNMAAVVLLLDYYCENTSDMISIPEYILERFVA